MTNETTQENNAENNAEAIEAQKENFANDVVVFQDVANLWGGLEKVSDAIADLKGAGMMNKAAKAEIAIDEVRALLGELVNVAHRQFNEVERFKREGFKNV